MRTNLEKKDKTIHQILRYCKYVCQEVCHKMADELETKTICLCMSYNVKI